MTNRSRWARANAPSLVDRITVATYRGAGGLGASYADPVTVLGWARGGSTLAAGTDTDTASATLALRLPPAATVVDEHGTPVLDADGRPVQLDALGLLTPGSRVTAAGATGVVTTATTVTSRGRVELITAAAE